MDDSYGRMSLVAFVDILGFSERVSQVEANEALQVIVDDIEMVQTEFERRGHWRAHLESHHSDAKKEVLAFSDCIVVSMALESTYTRSEGVFDGFLQLMLDFALAQATCVLQNVFLRGGIDLGLWYHEEDTLVSPPLVRAYRLEKNISVPVIGITDELYELLSSDEGRHNYGEGADPLDGFFRFYTDPARKRRYRFIDYLPLCVSNLSWITDKAIHERYLAADVDKRSEIRHQGWAVAAKRWLEQHKLVILDAYSSADDEHVRDKFRWLAQYHNEYVSQMSNVFDGCRIQFG